MGDVVAPECQDPMVLLPAPAHVAALRRRIYVLMRSTDDSVTHCEALSPDERRDWDRFFLSWQEEAAFPVGMFEAGKRWASACAFSSELSSRRDELKKKCVLVGPEDIPKPPPFDLSPLKWVAGAVIVIGVAWTVRSVVLAVK